MVLAELVERSLPLSDVSSSNPVMGKIYIEHLFTVNCIEKTTNKEKEAGNGPIKNICIVSLDPLNFDRMEIAQTVWATRVARIRRNLWCSFHVLFPSQNCSELFSCAFTFKFDFTNWGKGLGTTFCVLYIFELIKKYCSRQWLWLSWQNGRFLHQRCLVRIQSSAIFIEPIFRVNCL